MTSSHHFWQFTALLIDAPFMAPPNKFIAPASHLAPETLLASLRDGVKPTVICRFKTDVQACAMACCKHFQQRSRRCKRPFCSPATIRGDYLDTHAALTSSPHFWQLFTAHLVDALCMAPTTRVIAPASHSASEILLASL